MTRESLMASWSRFTLTALEARSVRLYPGRDPGKLRGHLFVSTALPVAAKAGPLRIRAVWSGRWTDPQTGEQADRWCLTGPDARQPPWTTRRFSLSPWASHPGRLVWPHRLGAGT